jgi:hypothetical protein
MIPSRSRELADAAPMAWAPKAVEDAAIAAAEVVRMNDLRDTGVEEIASGMRGLQDARNQATNGSCSQQGIWKPPL